MGTDPNSPTDEGRQFVFYIQGQNSAFFFMEDGIHIFTTPFDIKSIAILGFAPILLLIYGDLITTKNPPINPWIFLILAIALMALGGYAGLRFNRSRGKIFNAGMDLPTLIASQGLKHKFYGWSQVSSIELTDDRVYSYYGKGRTSGMFRSKYDRSQLPDLRLFLSEKIGTKFKDKVKKI